MNRTLQTTTLTPEEEGYVKSLVSGTEHLAHEELRISKALAYEIVYFARRFADPVDIINFFLEAGCASVELDLWEVLSDLESAWEEYSSLPGFHTNTNLPRGLSVQELHHLRQKFGF